MRREPDYDPSSLVGHTSAWLWCTLAVSVVAVSLLVLHLILR